MAFLNEQQVNEITNKLTDDLSILGKLYKSKKSEFHIASVDHSLVEDYVKQGWEEFLKPLKTKTRLRKLKSHSRKFEDDVWCQFYELGYRKLNIDETFSLPFSKTKGYRKQIDVVAINNETVFLVECKSSENSRKAPSYRDEFELLGRRIRGFKKSIHQIFGKQVKVKHIFAMRNLRIDPDGVDIERLEKTGSFLYNNNTYEYIKGLIRSYKNAAIYQFLGLMFKHELISKDRIEIPAIKGKMGRKTYYMFSLEPTLLLKMGFILHRTRVNESEFPTYQRLLVPSRLKNITKFIDDGGYFPNSIILNFSSKKNRIQFEAGSRRPDSNSCFGTLKIPNSYGIAYIIDGQHRIYGYANSNFKVSNTIPVVAFDGLETGEQLRIFMEINENQKKVSPTLRIDLEEDLFWDAERADSRLKALRSSVAKELSNSQAGPLFEKISIGEDKSFLSLKPFTTAISASGLLPSARGNKYDEESVKYSLYDVNNYDHNDEMIRAKRRIVGLLNRCYEFVEDRYYDIFSHEKSFIVSNRGTYAFICLIGSLNEYLIKRKKLTKTSSTEKRFEAIEKYLDSLLAYLKKIDKDEQEKQLNFLGAGADTKWLRFFQSVVHDRHENYFPAELVDWQERQDEELQDKGRKLGVAIEKRMKLIVLKKIKTLYETNWELEINSIKRECQTRAEQEMEKNYKDGLEIKEIPWTEMFNIFDYKKIIEGYWTKKPENMKDGDEFRTFQEEFSIDNGEGVGSKAKALKWISFFNSYRNLWAHEGTKEKRLNKKEVEFLEGIHSYFYENN